jgi:site-specific DNA recombinase
MRRRYDNVEVTDDHGRRSHVERRINENEAAVVRRIFELAKAGHGLPRIAKALNEDRAPSPRAQQGRPAGWCPSSVREVLHRPLYRGEIIWNRSRKRDRWGVKNQTARPDQEWIRIPAPDLAIVDDALWTAAHAAMERQRERYSRNSPNGAPPWSIEARYLLTGLLRCAVCGAGLEARSRSHGNRRVVFYGCSAYHRRGCSVCRNRLTVPMDLANDAVILELKSGLLNPRVLKAAVARVAKRLCSARGDTYVSAVLAESWRLSNRSWRTSRRLLLPVWTAIDSRRDSLA